MAGTSFTDLHDYVRVATGNDDPVVGVETLPDARIDVLLKIAILTLPSYSESFPALSIDLSGDIPSVAQVGSPDAPLSSLLSLAIAFAAAHRYYVGIGNKTGAAECLSTVFKTAELVSGHALAAANESDLLAALIYLKRKQSEATAQTNLR